MSLLRVAASAALVLSLLAYSSARAGDALATVAAQFARQFCLDCHSGKEAEAGVDLAAMVGNATIASSFKKWQKVAALVEQRKMPPKDELQPTEIQRQEFVRHVRGMLDKLAAEHANDP